MYKKLLKSKGYDVEMFNSEQRIKLNHIIRLESKHRQSMISEELTEEEIEAQAQEIERLKTDFEAFLPDPKTEIEKPEEKTKNKTEGKTEEKEVVEAKEEPNPKNEEKSSGLFGVLAILGTALIGALFIASGVKPNSDE